MTFLPRGPWRWAAVALAVCAAAAIAFYVIHGRRERRVRIAAGARGGQGHLFAQALARVVEAEVPRLRIEVVETSGASDNMDRLARGEVDLAVAQNDVPPARAARAVAFLYPQLFHLVVPRESAIRGVADLRTARIGTPPAGGGSYRSFVSLAKRYGLSTSELALSSVPSAELNRKFLAGDLDAVFRVDMIGDEGLDEVLSGGRARLVPIDQAAAMRLEHPYLEAFTIPVGAYVASPPVPDADVETVGVQTVLFARASTSGEVVRQLTQVLIEHQRDLTALAPALVHVRSPLDSPAVVAPLHAGARAYYERDKPGFLVVYSEVIGLLITLAGIGASFVLALRARLSARKKDRADRYNVEIVALLDAASAAADSSEIADAERRLLALFKRVIEDLDRDRVAPDTMQTFTLTWQTVMAALRHREAMLARSGSSSPP